MFILYPEMQINYPMASLTMCSSMGLTLNCVRPSFHPRAYTYSASAGISYAAFYNAVRAHYLPSQRKIIRSCSLSNVAVQGQPEKGPRIRTWTAGNSPAGPYDMGSGYWPRMPKQKNAIDVKLFRARYEKIFRGETMDDDVIIRGKQTLRTFKSRTH